MTADIKKRDWLREYSEGRLAKSTIMAQLRTTDYTEVLSALRARNLGLPRAAPSEGREEHLSVLAKAIASGRERSVERTR